VFDQQQLRRKEKKSFSEGRGVSKSKSLGGSEGRELDKSYIRSARRRKEIVYGLTVRDPSTKKKKKNVYPSETGMQTQFSGICQDE